MERALLDTDIFSEILRRWNAQIITAAEKYLATFGRFSLSAVTLAELIDGFRRRSLDANIASLLEKLAIDGHSILSFDFESAKVSGRILGDLHRTGQPVGPADPMIAATAIVNVLVLVTGNTEHFQRIQALGYALRIENWRGA
jgi:tRNA(fMet)-specific endonuclease VapC